MCVKFKIFICSLQLCLILKIIFQMERKINMLNFTETLRSKEHIFILNFKTHFLQKFLPHLMHS